MRTPDSNLDDKRAVGEFAADLVKDGMVVGLGTGSTVAWTIQRVGEMVEDGLEILCVATSYQADALAVSCGIPVVSLCQHPLLDLAIDGADQIDHELVTIKGGGGAHFREKVISASAKRFVIVADGSKYVNALNAPVPLEVLPLAANLVARRVRDLGGEPILRQAVMKDGPVISDNGNFLIDANFGVIENPASLASLLCAIPGVVEHGLFHNVDQLLVGEEGTVEVINRRA